MLFRSGEAGEDEARRESEGQSEECVCVCEECVCLCVCVRVSHNGIALDKGDMLASSCGRRSSISTPT